MSIFTNFKSIFWLLLVLGLLLRVQGLDRSLWSDEVMYSTSLFLKDLYHVWHLALVDTPAPLYRIFLFFWIRVFGDSEIAVRLPSLIFSIASLALSYRIIDRFADGRTALLAMALLSLSPVHIWYSHEAVPYSMFLFFTLMSICSFERMREGGQSPIWTFMYGFFVLLTVFTHWFGIGYLIIFSGLALFIPRQEKKNVLVSNGVIAAGLVIFFIVKHELGSLTGPGTFLRPFTLMEWWMLFFNWFAFGNSIWTVSPYSHSLGSVVLSKPLLLLSQSFYAVLFVLGLKGCYEDRAKQSQLNIVFYALALPVFVLGLSLSGHKHIYIERYLIPVLPFFYFLAAMGAVRLRSGMLRWVSMILLVMFSVAALIGSLLGSQDEKWTVYKPNPDWRSAVNDLIAEQDMADRPGVVWVTTSSVEIEYYKRRFRNKNAANIKVDFYTTNSIRDLLSEQRTMNLYLIKNIFWAGGFDAELKAVSEIPGSKQLSTKKYYGIRLYKFEISTGDALQNTIQENASRI